MKTKFKVGDDVIPIDKRFPGKSEIKEVLPAPQKRGSQFLYNRRFKRLKIRDAGKSIKGGEIMNDEIETILTSDEHVVYKVGCEGITKIEMTTVNGEMAPIGWLVVYKEEQIVSEMKANNYRIVYKEAK